MATEPTGKERRVAEDGGHALAQAELGAREMHHAGDPAECAPGGHGRDQQAVDREPGPARRLTVAADDAKAEAPPRAVECEPDEDRRDRGEDDAQMYAAAEDDR